MAATIPAWMTFAPVTLRERNRRGGSSGWPAVACRRTNAANRRTPPAPKHRGRTGCAPDPLPEARGDQHWLADRDAAEQRGRREQGEPAQEDAPATDQIAKPSGQQHEAAVGD